MDYKQMNNRSHTDSYILRAFGDKKNNVRKKCSGRVDGEERRILSINETSASHASPQGSAVYEEEEEEEF